VFAELADILLNLASPARYSYAWDIGKLITVASASIVLIVMLFSIAGLYGRLAKSAKTDMLTRLANRRAFEEHFQMVFHHARRQHQSMALLVVDIDFFKGYNDAHGHLAGDACLRQIASAMAAGATRSLDLVCRYGGEEFVVVLPDTPLHGVLVVAERIRAAIERLDLVHCDKALGRVTVSIGAGHVLDALTSDETTLFEAADRALFAAKAAGRNRVLAGADPSPHYVLEPAPVISTIAVTSVTQIDAVAQVASAQVASAQQ
jgi:diguanylate cyclase (GGDEF)-like protein